jgi:phage gpG-like protein
VRVTMNRLLPLTSAQKAGVARARRRAALKIEGDWKGGVRVDTGTLRRSIRTEERGDESHVVSDVEYSVYQEFGTGVMAANPAATRAAERNRRPYAADAAAEIGRAT